MPTTVPVPAPSALAATPRARPFGRRGRRLLAVRPSRRLLAVAAVAAGLSIPLTGAGSAIAAPHPPSLTSTVAALSALTPPVAMGKLDV
jgi:hypothetical protein